MTANYTISSSRNHQSEGNFRYGVGYHLGEKLENLRKYSSREIITQLGITLSHPRNYVQEVIPGQLSSYLLERYENEGIEVLLRCSRSKSYLRRWFLSRIITYGNIGNDEMIVATIAFEGNPPLFRLFHLIITKINKRKTDLILETYELCRRLYPLLFPTLPNVEDSQTEPKFFLALQSKQKRKVQKSNRVRNPSAVGGKHGRGVAPLPMEPTSGTGPSNVDELFLETYNILVPGNSPFGDSR